MSTFKVIGWGICFYVLLQLLSLPASAQTPHKTTRVNVADWGIVSGNGKNIVPLVKKMLTFYKDNTGLSFEFAAGRYDLWPDVAAFETTGFNFSGMRGVTLNGNGT
jgi:hypothetical protein